MRKRLSRYLRKLEGNYVNEAVDETPLTEIEKAVLEKLASCEID